MTPATCALVLAGLFLGAPLLAALILAIARRPAGPVRVELRLTALSALAFALAYNLVFLTQEVGLVIPKAFTPGLQPTLFHNNHDWTGHHPLENLFQGTGAVATLLLGLACAAWLKLRPPRSEGARLFAIWIAILGPVSALAQVLIGTVIPQNDVGRAMGFLGLSDAAKLAACVVVIIAMAAACAASARQFLALAPHTSGPGAVFRLAALPAVLALVLIVPFRMPGPALEILFPPLVSILTTALWMQAWSWSVRPAGGPAERRTPLWAPGAMLLALLALFQVVLRPGVPFY